MRRFVCPDLDGDELVLDDTASHHLAAVLRLVAGDAVVLFDGRGRERPARIVTPGPPARLAPTGPAREVVAVETHLVLGIPKGPAMDLAVRLATELGATHIHPVRAARTVATGDRRDRWLRIATSAAQQCGRADVPAVATPAPLDTVIAALPAHVARRLAVPGGPVRSPHAGPLAVAVGPEGGFTPRETDALVAAGFVPRSLGAFVLRTPTAVAAALELPP